MAETKKEKAPTEEVSTRRAEALKELKENKSFYKKIKEERRVKVYGNELFKDSMGTSLTYLHNGVPVTIKFDNTYQEFPESIAYVLEKKLAKIARANATENKKYKL